MSSTFPCWQARRSASPSVESKNGYGNVADSPGVAAALNLLVPAVAQMRPPDGARTFIPQVLEPERQRANLPKALNEGARERRNRFRGPEPSPAPPRSANVRLKEREVAKRELIDTGKDKRYVRRDAKGRFTQSDDVGRSLSQDVRKKAKKTVKPGHGDKGDQKRK